MRSSRSDIHRLIAHTTFLVVLSLMLANSVSAQVTRLNIDRSGPVIEAESKVWIGTSDGLHQYNPDDDTFKHLALPVEGRLAEVRDLYSRDEWLWCVLDSGLAALHMRLNEWLYFDAATGLPSDRVTGLDFHEDYVWVATPAGPARFDLLIEEWEGFDLASGVPDLEVNDVVSVGDQVWLVMDHTFSEYDPQFEKWRHFRVAEDTSVTLERGFLFRNGLWLLSDRGLTRFDTGLETQQSFFQPHLAPANLIELMLVDSAIWAVTRTGIYHYEETAAVWREFEGNTYLEGSTLVDAYVDRSEIWVVTDSKVLVWDSEAKGWETLNYASGLSGSIISSVYSSGGMAFLLGPSGFDYRKSSGDIWRRHDIAGAGGGGISGRNMFKNLLDNEEGGHVQLGRYRWAWSGTRMTFIHNYQQMYKSAGVSPDAEISSGQRMDIKSQLPLGEARGLSGFYNNIDYSETMYGVRYRSRANDILREFTWGDFRRERGRTPFGETASIFGSSVWLQAGDKTPRFKRSAVTAKAISGERRSQKTYEHFRGTTSRSETMVRDIDYMKYKFYAAGDLDSLSGSATLEIYMDDKNPATNDPNTLEGTRIAGIIGDFDLLVPTEDYFLYEKAGVIWFKRVISPSSSIVMRRTDQGGVHESVLQHEEYSTAQKNFYFLKGLSIIPYSFAMVMIDSAGREVPLSEFGLDRDGDGFVDSEWIDYENGILFFPDAEPFPPPIYDPDAPRSFFHMDLSFATTLPLIILAHSNLVRGSEVLWLDGVVAEGGNDYVLDYTNGTLVFVREGLVSTDTRIEIEYEYLVTSNTTQLHGAAFNVSPSDEFYVQADWLNFSRNLATAAGRDSAANLVIVHGEVRESVGGYDLIVTPGVAYQADDAGFSGGYVEGLISSSRLRLRGAYEDYARDYVNLYRPQSVIGPVSRAVRLDASLDISPDIRLTGELDDVTGFEDSNASSSSTAGSGNADSTGTGDRARQVGFLFHRQHWPGWQFAYQDFRTDSGDAQVERRFFLNRIDYRLPEQISRRVRVQDLRLEALLRNGSQSAPLMLSEEQDFRHGQFRVRAAISDQFQSSLFYRRNDLEDTSPGEAASPITRAERMLFDLAYEEWRFLQVNLHVENTLDQGFHRDSSIRDCELNQYSQVNLRMSPGQAWHTLNPLYFEFNVSRSLRGAGEVDGNTGSWVWRFASHDGDSLDDSRLIRSYYLRNEFRPGPRWYINSFIEWDRQETDESLSSIQTTYWRWNEKLDFKIGYRTHLNVGYQQQSEDLGFERTRKRYEPSAWIEYRLTSDLQNTLYGLYRRGDNRDGLIRDITDYWEARYDLVWRTMHLPVMRRMQLRQTFSASNTTTEGYNPEESVLLASNTSLDLYPLYSTVLRFRFDLARYVDQLVQGNDYSRIALDLRLTLTF